VLSLSPGTSIPTDLLAKDWEINRVKPQDLPDGPSGPSIFI
jgi:hypothetical protein